MQNPSVPELVELARSAALAAGRLVQGASAANRRVALTKSSKTDAATAMDMASEAMLAKLIKSRRPHDGLLAEEGAHTTSKSGLTWVVDPIDGTVNYSYGLPFYAVSVAVVTGEPTPESWRVLAGAIHAPELGATWWAGQISGALKNGRRLTIQGDPDPAMALIGTGFGYRPEDRAWQAQRLTQVLAKVRDIRRMGSSAIDLAHVAEGRLDGYFETGLNPWDMAAGLLLVSEAGGKVLGKGGAAPGYDLTVAGPPALADWLVRSLRY